MDTSLAKSSATRSLSSRLYPLVVKLRDAIKAYEDALATGSANPDTVYTVLATVASAIEGDEEMKARPKLAELVTPSKDSTALPSLSKAQSMAMSNPMRLGYFKDVLARLTEEVDAPEGGRRRRRRKTRKTRRTRVTRRR